MKVYQHTILKRKADLINISEIKCIYSGSGVASGPIVTPY